MSTNVYLPGDVAKRRAGRPHTSMFLRMLLRAAVLRRGRAASALLAMVVAAAVATAMLNLYSDVEAKLQREFRSYGANIVVVAKPDTPLPSNAMELAESVVASQSPMRLRETDSGGAASGSSVVPFGYVVARTANGQSVVVAGTDFERVRRLNSWWNVSAWPASHLALNHSVTETSSPSAGKAPSTATVDGIVGIRAAQVATPQGRPF